MLVVTFVYIIVMSVVLFGLSRMRHKFWFVIGLAATTLMAVWLSIWLLGGELLWIRFVMALPVPDGVKCILFGW